MLVTGNNSTLRYLILLRIIVIFDHDEYSLYSTRADFTHISSGISNEQNNTLADVTRHDIQVETVRRLTFSGTNWHRAAANASHEA